MKKPGSDYRPPMIDGKIPTITKKQKQSMRLLVCSKATDAADARLLMEALGLIEAQP